MVDALTAVVWWCKATRDGVLGGGGSETVRYTVRYNVDNMKTFMFGS